MMQQAGTKRSHNETENTTPEEADNNQPSSSSAAAQEPAVAASSSKEEAQYTSQQQDASLGGQKGDTEEEIKREEDPEPQAKRSRTEETPTEESQQGDTSSTPSATPAAAAAAAAAVESDYTGGGGYGDYGSYSSGAAAGGVDYSGGGYDHHQQQYHHHAAYAGTAYDPSAAYANYAASSASGYDSSSTSSATATAPSSSATPAAPAAPIPDSLSPDPPSKVLHFRNVTSEITQEDIMEMAAPFGTVEKVVMLTTKNQALLEFSDISSAILMSNFYINTQPNIRGRKVYMRFSRHQQLTASAAGPNRILLVTLHTDQEPVIPITADIVWQIFSSYGFIEKIVVMNKQAQEYSEESRRDSRLQTLVQFSSPASAQTASQYLNGKTVYVGTDPIMSITLFIQYSHLSQLTVKHNSASARDYVTPLPWGNQYQPQQPHGFPQQPYGAPPGYGGYPPMPMPGHGMGPPQHGGGYM